MKARAIDRQDQTRYPHTHQLAGKRIKRQRVNPVLLCNEIDLDKYLRQLALTTAKEGNYSEAIALFTQLIAKNPTNAADFNNRGLIYFQSGAMEEAIADYNKALELNPELASAYNNQGNYYAAIGKMAESIAAYDRAIDLNPSYFRAWLNQGITFRQLGLYDLALANFDFALLLGQLQGNLYAERGRTYHLRGDWNCAIADYQRALIHLPQANHSSVDSAARLRLQVQTWFDDLLNPNNLGF